MGSGGGVRGVGVGRVEAGEQLLKVPCSSLQGCGVVVGLKLP